MLYSLVPCSLFGGSWLDLPAWDPQQQNSGLAALDTPCQRSSRQTSAACLHANTAGVAVILCKTLPVIWAAFVVAVPSQISHVGEFD